MHHAFAQLLTIFYFSFHRSQSGITHYIRPRWQLALAFSSSFIDQSTHPNYCAVLCAGQIQEERHFFWLCTCLFQSPYMSNFFVVSFHGFWRDFHSFYTSFFISWEFHGYFWSYCIISDSIYHTWPNFWSCVASFNPDIHPNITFFTEIIATCSISLKKPWYSPV